MELRFKYEKEECIRGYRTYQFIMKRVTKLQLVILPLAILYCVALVMMEGASTFTIILSGVVGVLTLLTAYVMLIQPEIIYRNTQKYHQEYRMVFSPENIQFTTEGMDSAYGWEVYTDIHETKTDVYLLQGKIGYTLIPKRAFAEGQLEDFRDIIKKKF